MATEIPYELTDTKSPLVDFVKVQLLTSSGARETFDYSPDITGAQLKQDLINRWPSAWPRISDARRLRLLYLGAFLDDDKPLSSLNNFDPASTLVLHLVVKPSAAEVETERKQDMAIVEPEDTSCSKCCTIM